MEQRQIKLELLAQNVGQIDGLPQNPREWTKKEVEKLRRSILETPELLEARGLIVTPHEGKYIILGGNMRYEAMKGLQYESAPCIVIPEGTPIAKLKEIVIKDNGAFGEWDMEMLANEWDDLPLDEWGVAVKAVKDQKMTEILSKLEFSSIYYEPVEKPRLRLEDCIDMEKYEEKVKAIESYDLTEGQKKVLRIFAYRFIRIDFEGVANYYAFNASEEEKKAIERLRLVLTDSGIEGFLQDDLLRIAELSNDYRMEEPEEGQSDE